MRSANPFAPLTMTKKHIILNAFNENCVGHINHGLWTHPRDRTTEYNTIEYWTDMARTLERGLFDGILSPTSWVCMTFIRAIST